MKTIHKTKMASETITKLKQQTQQANNITEQK